MAKPSFLKRNMRHFIQAVSTLLHNPFVGGFFTHKIYQGAGKSICVPGLNCYSCPAAIGACPIGSLQQALYTKKALYYVLGTLILIGVTLGRVVCGFLCPFGLLQDLLYKIPFFKKINHFKADKWLRWLKYVILAVFVIILPLFFVDAPTFCKYICPQGTLQGGVALAPFIGAALGFLYAWKVVILIVILVLCLIIYRPFCKYLCPLGAIYGLFNPIAVVRLHVDKKKCTDCGACAKVCKMCIEPSKHPNSIECIRCGDCKAVCPHGAIKLGIKGERNNGQKENGI